MNDTIKTPEDVSLRFKLPFLGLVPSVRGDKHPLLASSHVPHDFGESFRSLRTSLVARYNDPGTKILDRHQRAAARRQDDHRGQHRDGAGLRRRARAADRRRHAPARPAPAAAADQRARPVAGAQRSGARARRDPADGGSEPAGDHRRHDAAEPVGAAVVGADEDAAGQPRARAVRLDSHRHAAGAGRHRRRDSRARGQPGSSM